MYSGFFLDGYFFFIRYFFFISVMFSVFSFGVYLSARYHLITNRWKRSTKSDVRDFWDRKEVKKPKGKLKRQLRRAPYSAFKPSPSSSQLPSLPSISFQNCSLFSFLRFIFLFPLKPEIFEMVPETAACGKQRFPLVPLSAFKCALSC